MGSDHQDKVNTLREDLKVEMEKINPQRGEIIIVKPKSDNIAFSEHYRNWVIDVLHALRPDVQIMVMTDNQLEIQVQKQ